MREAHPNGQAEKYESKQKKLEDLFNTMMTKIYRQGAKPEPECNCSMQSKEISQI